MAVVLGAAAPPALVDDPESSSPAVAAFPGAVGFGASSEGGRGGEVAIVTSLADDGHGSLREALRSAAGPLTIVFEVGGIIDLASPLRITASHLTIAGQTAPGGITIRGYPVEVVGSSHIVLRHLRFRPGDIHAIGVPGRPSRGNGDLSGDAADALSILTSEHVVVDHVSASWSMDETLSVTKSANVTVQNSIISESLDDSFHPEGTHGYGSLVRGTGERGYTFWGNLWAHHQRRMPALGGQQDPPPPGVPGKGLDVDVVNNVIYDWSLLPTHTLSEPYQLRVNLEGNSYVKGTGGVPGPVFNIEATAQEFQVFSDGNLYDSDGDHDTNFDPLVGSNFLGPVTLVDQRFDFDRPDVPVIEPTWAYVFVLWAAGASRYRDEIDARIVTDVVNRTGVVINSQADVGGWVDNPRARRAPKDRDRDGMSDSWERRRGLDSRDPTDRNGHDLDPGFTNLEVYLAALV